MLGAILCKIVLNNGLSSTICDASWGEGTGTICPEEMVNFESCSVTWQYLGASNPDLYSAVTWDSFPHSQLNSSYFDTKPHTQL